MRIDRLLAIILILLKRRRATAPELAREFEVSVRTIYRDIDAIGAAGIPIVSTQGAGGGIGILESYKLDRQVLTPDEMLSMLGALRGVGAVLGDSRLVRAGRKIEALLPEGQVDRLDDELFVDLLPWGSSAEDAESLRLVRSAIAARRLLAFEYRGASGASAARRVEPMTLVLRGSLWYLFAFCRLREDYRLFRLSRMRAPRIEDERFERRSQRYDQYSRESERSRSRANVDLVLRFAPRARRMVEDYFGREQIEEQADASLLVRVTWPEDDWVYATLLSYGPSVQIVEPPRLRTLIRERAEATWRQYADE